MYRIAVIPGDGIGPEVVNEGLKVLEAAAAKTGVKYELQHYELDGERYLRTGEVLPDSVLEELRGFDAIYLGAVGHPDVEPGILEKGLLLRLRFELDQYINLRPVKLYPGVETPLKDKGPTEGDRLRHRAGEHGGAVQRHGRHPVQGDAPRGLDPDPHDHPPRRRAGHPLRLRAVPESQSCEATDAFGQDQRPHLRPRHLVARLQRGGRR